jgi:hypothetical protein
VKTDWEAWNTRSLADEPIVRLILDGTLVRVRLDRKATSISAANFWWVEQLRGHDLATHEPLDRPSHADVLLELANRPGKTSRSA